MNVFINHPLNLAPAFNSLVEKVSDRETSFLSLLIREEHYYRTYAILDNLTEDRVKIDGKNLWKIGEVRISLTIVHYV